MTFSLNPANIYGLRTVRLSRRRGESKRLGANARPIMEC
jgi:hypothetical protein